MTDPTYSAAEWARIAAEPGPKQHEYRPGGSFAFREPAGVPPHIVYIDSDEQGRRCTTFVAEVYANALEHARALVPEPAAPITADPLTVTDESWPCATDPCTCLPERPEAVIAWIVGAVVVVVAFAAGMVAGMVAGRVTS